MARKKREWYPGAIYHVMSRGNRQKAIFNTLVPDPITKILQNAYSFWG